MPHPPFALGLSAWRLCQPQLPLLMQTNTLAVLVAQPRAEGWVGTERTAVQSAAKSDSRVRELALLCTCEVTGVYAA